jgi:hypothetical protein
VLDAYEKALGDKLKERRFRIEHFQIVAPEDIPRAIKDGVIASMQTTHATSDMNMAEDRVGSERIKTSYAWRTVIEEGGVIANGSDAPVELVNPYHGLYAAVTRQDRNGEPPNGWYANQAMTREEALKSFTIWGAYGIFAENNRGSLEAGKYADFVVIDKDYMTCPASEIKDIIALTTVIGGEVVYEYTAPEPPVNPPKPSEPGTRPGSGSGGSVASPTSPATPAPDTSSPAQPAVTGVLARFSDGAGVSDWAKAYFERLIESGIISGYSDGSLSPKGQVTRAEFTKMAVVALGVKLEGTPKVFANDVKEGNWYKEFVDIASANGIIEGLTEGVFGPNEKISRQDISVIMYRAFTARGVTLPVLSGETFPDQALIADYAKDAVSMLRQLGIIGGRTDGSFDPKAYATREETAKIICGVIDYANANAAVGANAAQGEAGAGEAPAAETETPLAPEPDASEPAAITPAAVGTGETAS